MHWSLSLPSVQKWQHQQVPEITPEVEAGPKVFTADEGLGLGTQPTTTLRQNVTIAATVLATAVIALRRDE
ncbi:hypothetical protein V6N11_036737 [Hibiscus sabdariffa]|uniref:Uncharacterized protein n=1 Tax=Hibiscus sabdariffa TaxID=183260 RepID=A0ABR2RBT9_9ROSI